MMEIKERIYDILFLSILLFLFSIMKAVTIAATYALCTVYVLIACDRSVFTKNQAFIYFVLTISFLLAVLNLNHGLTSAFYLFASPFIITSARLFSNKPHQHIVLCLRDFYWLFVFGIAVGLMLHWDDPEPLGAIFPGLSTNGLPSFLIVVQIAFSIAYYLKNSRLPLLSASTTLTVSVFGLGRGSMIVATLIFLFSLFINLIASKSKIYRSLLLTATGLLMLSFGLYFYNNYSEFLSAVDLVIRKSKFSNGILDEYRGQMLTDYLNKIDAWSLIWGASYDDTSIAQNYGGNPHNSFIRLHSFYGISGLLCVPVSLFLMVISNRRLIQKNVTLILIILALLRATTEPIFFPSTLDFFYFLYFFLFFNFAQKKYCTHSQNA